MRSAIAATLLAAACLSGAQTFTQGERLVQDGFEALRRTPSIWLRQSGTQTLNGRGFGFFLDTFWYLTYDVNGQPLAKLECLETRDESIVSRIVGDGRTLWAYDAARKEYASTNYGSYTAPPQPPTYLQTLLQGFGTHARGQATHPARLLREVYSGGFALYRPWIVGAQEAVIQGTASMDDPVLGSIRTYQATPTRTYVVFWNGAAATRSFAFQLDQNGSGVWELTAIFHADLSKVGATSKLIDWQMAIQPVQPSVANFIFVPPANAKPVVRQGGGI